MTDRPASWRMPTPKQMEKLAGEARRPSVHAAAPDEALPTEYWESLLQDPRAGNGVRMRQRKLSEIQHHVLRVSCRRCERIVERPWMLSASSAATPSGKMSRSGSWTTGANNAPADTKKTAAGRRSRRHRRQKSTAGAIARAVGAPISLGHGNLL